MKLNTLISEITRGQWLLDTSDGRGALFQRLALDIIAGKPVQLNNQSNPDTADLITSYYDKNAKQLSEEDAENSRNDLYGKVSMRGPIIKHGDYCTWGADEIVQRLDSFNDNPKIKGIILEIDSPGGSVSAAGIFQDFGLRKKKPVIVMADLCCSLGYLASVTIGDRIFADNQFSSKFGSIGVVTSFVMPTKEYFAERNLEYHEVYADESADKNKVSQLLKEGKVKEGYKLLKEDALSPMAKKFQNIVLEKRPNISQEKGVLTGGTFMYDKALEYGLIDGYADLQKAIKYFQII